MKTYISDPTVIDRALCVATACAVGMATLLTPIAYQIHRSVVRVFGMRILAALIGLLSCVAIYAASNVLFEAIAEARLSPTTSTPSYAQLTFVHPGPTLRLIPMLGVGVVWLSLAWFYRMRDQRSGHAHPADLRVR
jgi:hypothetical protein